MAVDRDSELWHPLDSRRIGPSDRLRVGGVHPDQQVLAIFALASNRLLHHPPRRVGLPQAGTSAKPNAPVAPDSPQPVDLIVETSTLVVLTDAGMAAHEHLCGR